MRSVSTRLIIVAGIFVATFAMAHAAAPVLPESAPRLESIPLRLAAWVGQPAPPLAPDLAKILAADTYVHRYYRDTAGTIEMDVAYYAQPRVGANMHSPLNCLPGNGWTMENPQSRRIDTPVGAWDVREIAVSRGASRFAMTYWFQSRQRVVGDEFAARLHLLGDALRRQPTDASLVRVMMPSRGALDAEHATLATFAAQLIPEIATRLRP